MIPWVPFDRVRAIYNDLRALDLAIPGARTISDVTGCPGATTCNLGITRSLTLADVLSRELEGYTDREIKKLRVKISGCPNSGGHHHIADIGFYGNVRKIGDQQPPYWAIGWSNCKGIGLFAGVLALRTGSDFYPPHFERVRDAIFQSMRRCCTPFTAPRIRL